MNKTDLWKHRSRNMMCRTCMYYVPKVANVPKEGVEIGRCRRHAPTSYGWVVVSQFDWCGDHKLDENKI